MTEGRNVMLARTETRKRRRHREREGRRKVEEYLKTALSMRAPVDEPFVLGIHSLMTPEAESPLLGSYRGIPVRVRWGRRVVYYAPEPEKVPVLMHDFFESVAGDHDSDQVRPAGRTLLRLLKIHPFREGNGRTARAVATYMLLLQGYRRRPLRTLEKYVDSNLASYYEALSSDDEGFPEHWDAYFCSAVEWTFRAPDSGRLADALAPVMGKLRRALK